MILALDKKKLRRRILLHGIPFLVFTGISILIPIMESDSNDKKSYEIVLAVLALLFIATISILPLIHLIRVRKEFHKIIRFENGILQDYSGILNHKKIIPTENIESVSVGILGTRIGNTNQLIVKLRNVNRTKNPLFDQLKGRVIYITDYIVDKKEFEKFAEVLHKTLPNKN